MPRKTVRNVLAKSDSFRLWPNPGLFAEIEDHEERAAQIEKTQREAANHLTDSDAPPG